MPRDRSLFSAEIDRLNGSLVCPPLGCSLLGAARRMSPFCLKLLHFPWAHENAHRAVGRTVAATGPPSRKRHQCHRGCQPGSLCAPRYEPRRFGDARGVEFVSAGGSNGLSNGLGICSFALRSRSMNRAIPFLENPKNCSHLERSFQIALTIGGASVAIRSSISIKVYSKREASPATNSGEGRSTFASAGNEQTCPAAVRDR